MILKPSVLASALTTLIEAMRPFLVTGKPGIGKSRLIEDTVNLLPRFEPKAAQSKSLLHRACRVMRSGWGFLDQRLTTMDPVDLRGVPSIEHGSTVWHTPDWFPTDEAVSRGLFPEKGLLFFDEATSVGPAMQAALYEILLDRRAAGTPLAAGWAIGAAGNGLGDNAVVQRTTSTVRSRFVNLEMEADLDDWCNWALKSSIEPSLIAFLRYRPNLLHNHSADGAFPCPRTWEFVSQIAQQKPNRTVELALFEGAVGTGAATEYYAFLDLYRKLPSIDSILLSPATSPVPEDPATLYAVSYALAFRATPINFGAVLQYLNRLRLEYSVLAVKAATQRDSALCNTFEFNEWATKNSDAVR